MRTQDRPELILSERALSDERCASVPAVGRQAAGKLLDQLGVAVADRAFARLGEAGALKPGTALPAPQGIFPRFVDPAEAADPPGRKKNAGR